MSSEENTQEAAIDVKDYPKEGSVLVEFYGDQVSHVLYGNKLVLTKREINDLKLCLFYANECNHGADGHNRMMLVSKLARALGIEVHRGEVTISSLFVGEVICE